MNDETYREGGKESPNGSRKSVYIGIVDRARDVFLHETLYLFYITTSWCLYSAVV